MAEVVFPSMEAAVQTVSQALCLVRASHLRTATGVLECSEHCRVRGLEAAFSSSSPGRGLPGGGWKVNSGR